MRRELQDIGYEFNYDVSARAQQAEFQAGWPAWWRISEAALPDDGAPGPGDYDLFTVDLIDYGEDPTFVLFSANGLGEDQGAVEGLATALMEVASRVPADAGIDAAVWYMTNLWLHEPGSEQRTTLPCLVSEFDDGAIYVATFGADQATPSYFGAVGRYDRFPGHLEQVEQCKALLAQVASAEADAEPLEEGGSSEPAVDYTVTPDEAVAAIKAGGHTVIDVRTPAEYEAAHVVGALNFDVEAPDFAERIAELDPDEPYLLYCRSGRRSDLAAQQMAGAGFTDILDAGGLADLARAGAPVE